LIDFSKTLLVLAPLAGYTDLPFRSVVKKFSADLTVSEMISSNALIYNSAKTHKMVEKSDNETPYSVQLAGNSAEIVAKAVDVLNGLDGIDCIDLNCGCPAKKVVNHGSGSSLLKDLNKLSDIAKAIKENSKKEYFSAKIRLGFESKNHLEIAKTLQDCGVDFIAVHGRTKTDSFDKNRIDYKAIREIKEALTIPVIANGDIDSFEKAQYVLEYTGVDGLMIGRGAVGNPWIFHQIKTSQSEIAPELKREIILEHFDKMVEFYGNRGVAMFRKHLHTYSKSLKGASTFRDNINRISEITLARGEIESFFG
jgi:tRNA-dihydrouridine synthase B